MSGGLSLDEDLAGMVGTPVSEETLSPEGKMRVDAALTALLADRAHEGIRKFRTCSEFASGEEGGNYVLHGTGGSCSRGGNGTGSVGDGAGAWNAGETIRHALPLAGALRDDLARRTGARFLRAGVAYRRVGGARQAVQWD